MPNLTLHFKNQTPIEAQAHSLKEAITYTTLQILSQLQAFLEIFSSNASTGLTGSKSKERETSEYQPWSTW